MIVGMPRMHKEAGERRDFVPSSIAHLASLPGVQGIFLEEGYGSAMSFTDGDYLVTSDKVKFTSQVDALNQDLVIVLRCPSFEELALMHPGAILVSMLHYRTNPGRVTALIDQGIEAVSIDSICDDHGHRLVENMHAVGWNGVEAAFKELASIHPRFYDPGRRPIRVTILGAGAVGAHAVHAAVHYGDDDIRRQMIGRRVPGVEVTVIDFDLTWDENYMRSRLEQTEILVDATQRRDPTRPVIPNRWLASLPNQSVILDLAADPYDFDATPPIVKGIEGSPHGDLDGFVFPVDHPYYDELSPHVETTHRRVALSCYAWPGVHPRECMDHYGMQLEPILEVIVQKPARLWSASAASLVERALARAEVRRWLASQEG
jgi:alanine dehydrogenase